MLPTQTHTYVTLEVSQSTYDEIASKLKEEGYEHCFHQEDTSTHVPDTLVPSILIDMHGIALKKTTELTEEEMFKNSPISLGDEVNILDTDINGIVKEITLSDQNYDTLTNLHYKVVDSLGFTWKRITELKKLVV